MELARQPVFLLLVTVAAVFQFFLASVPYFGFGDDPKMVKDSVLAVGLLSGLLCAVLSASSSIGREIRGGTALAVLSKPVGRALFLLSKYAGVAAALTVLGVVNIVCSLLASRMAFDAYGGTDKVALGILAFFILLAYAAAGFSNFFLRRPFVSDALFGLVLALLAAFVVINFLGKKGEVQPFGLGLDPRMIPAGVLILLALYILAAVAVACSTRLEMIPSLVVCSSVFLVGLMSDYLFRTGAENGSVLATVLYTVLPNWQLFWMSDVLETDKLVPGFWAYVSKATLYVVCYVGAVMAVSVALFEDRELS
jgi:hypothetical protein